jgi:hypothetical protein
MQKMTEKRTGRTGSARVSARLQPAPILKAHAAHG